MTAGSFPQWLQCSRCVGGQRVPFVRGTGVRGRYAGEADVLQGRRPDLPGEVSGVPSAELDRADVAHHLSRKRGRGPVRSRSASPPGRCRRGTSTAASASRSSRTTCRSRDEQVDTIVRWVDGGVAAGRSERPAAGQAARDRQRVASRARRIRQAGSRREVLRVHDARRAPGRLVPADVGHPAERAALGEDGRDSSDQPQVAQDHPSLDRLSRAQQRSRGREHRDGQRSGSLSAATISSTVARS